MKRGSHATVTQIVQGLFFAFFLYLFVLAAFPLRSAIPVDLFLRIDPLIALTTYISGREIISSMLIAGALLLLTAILGRFFCAYVCPTGTAVDISDFLLFRKVKKLGLGRYIGVRNLKYYLLILILFASLFGVGFAYLFDPISILTRTFAFVFYPFVRFVLNLGLDVLRPIARWIEVASLVHSRYYQPVFSMNIVTLAIFGLIIGLGALQSRFWCRNLCPLGALLSFVSRFSLLKGKVSEGCIECAKCAHVCDMDAIVGQPSETISRECSECLKCLDVCPEGVIGFGIMGGVKGHARAEIDLSRRSALASLGAGFVAATLVGTHGLSRLKTRQLIRPPGSVPEKAFLDRCIRCGECLKACPTNTLQPAFLESGWEGLWSPRLATRFAPCDPQCNVCGWVCPTRAIRALALEEKRAAHIGTAVLDRDACWPWKEWKTCQICFDECKAAGYNAVELHVINGWKKPLVLENRCVGCGLCEFRCPVNNDIAAGIKGLAAITVIPDGEQRITRGSYIELNRKTPPPNREPLGHPVIRPEEEQEVDRYLPPFLR